MAGEGFAGLAVDEEADLGDAREGGVEGADDGEEGEGFDLDAGGVVVGEGAAEIDDGELAGVGGVGLGGGGDGDEEDVVDGGAAVERVGGAGEGVGGEEVVEQDAGADGGVLREGELLLGGGDGGVGVVGEVEGDVFGAGGDGGGDGGVVVVGGEALVGLLAAVEEEGGHEEDGGGEGPEEDALVAGDHRAAPAGVWVRQVVRAVAMASATRCW